MTLTRTTAGAALALAALVPAAARAQRGGPPAALTLARGGATAYVVVSPPGGSAPEALAAAELAAYLGRISGATFRVAPSAPAGAHPIVVRVVPTADTAATARDGYTIAVRGDSLVLTGASPRAALYAAYDLLERLGCRWLAPALAFHQGAHELVPRRATLVYTGPATVAERPRFAIRKVDVSEGMSHDSASLRAIVAWMPKLRFNTLMAPQDFGGSGRVTWDRWRDALTPELRRRDLRVEIGGHGWQNFLSARRDGALFAAHPEWFGRDAQCRPSREERLAFNTSDSGAVRHVLDGVVRYLRDRSEIDVFDFWPPDGVRWAECAADAALGSPADRQARLANALVRRLRAEGLRTRVQIIAYANLKSPPTVALDPEILVDFCPIGQNFDVAIDDAAGANNRQYVDTLAAWRAVRPRNLGVYAYYRRYAWRSLPVLLPRYIAHDLRWHAGHGMTSVSSYVEPGDWFTYELNHVALGRLAWNPDADAEALIDDHARARFGTGATAAAAALRTLEDVVRTYGSVPYSAPKPLARVTEARRLVERRLAAVRDAAARANATDGAALRRLALMLDFARRDLALQELRLTNAPADARRAQVEALVAMLTANADAGTFLMYGRADRARYLRHYGLDATAPTAAADTP
ncbi:DUF4838 domain-containing protein [Roseisolibacter agri]|uniref:Alpha glucuronidase N-terminal domain-containing protein n=1 Tax=Roseisolibacter agri TaxID=2014610 RepID=A0AA37QBJ4_9BACT|nr:DUF4838 domain-containing protein [Roseisolibacter agri]GLC23643.1 hypothetical protein rosag_01560 [Roseisolibacter agri]